ncbi:glutamine-synthetase adenylyltransferase [Litoreibacter roseus]|nr:glutamine-synthetase adenylyltransferase [Litoreibacter roseus]
MDFASGITRAPLPYTASRGEDMVALYPDASEDFAALVRGTGGCSPYLASLLEKEADWLRDLPHRDPEAMKDEVLQGIKYLQGGDLKPGLRQAKRRLAALTALADLGGVWSLEQVTGALTELADRALQRGLTHLIEAEIAKGKLPGLTEDDIADAGGMCILAMGKMGAGELNYSSDIDLICLFDETRFNSDDYSTARAAFVRVTRALMALMSTVTEDGYVFRTDLRLRPDASVTPVCIAMEAAERYYESVGRTWERAAFIKARPCAGDIAAGAAFLDRLTPFVWRRHLDFAAIQDAHDMRLRIRDHKALSDQITLEGHDMKLGPGGIREIEFFTQTRQLIAGGRDTGLRQRETMPGLYALANADWIPADLAQGLSTQYRAHREVEHRLQMLNDAQTHTLPTSADGFDRLARFSGMADTARYRADLLARLHDVAEKTEAFFEGDSPGRNNATGETDTYLSKWRQLPALRSPRAVQIFSRVFPSILSQLKGAARPEEAIAEFEQFLSGLPAGVQLFSLFEANPKLTQLIADICATAPALAAYLSRNAGVLDAVIGGGFFAAWPGRAALTDDLTGQLAQAGDYEAQLDTARRWQKEWHFRIGVHHLRGLTKAAEAGTQYSDLARAVLAALLPVVLAEFARKHGAAPGRGMAVLAMGSLGAGRLTAQSDLDLIVIYDADGVETSVGPKPLAARAYYARATQALITALTAATAEGKLYDVDMRLRPSGQAGPVATSLGSFRTYQMEEAWIWEHLALTRGQAVAGDAALRQDIETVRHDVLGAPHDKHRIVKEMQDMRQRLADAGRDGAPWDWKLGPGGAQDIDLLVQALALVHGGLSRDVFTQISDVAEAHLLSQDDAAVLTEARALFAALAQAMALLVREARAIETLGRGAQMMILRETGQTSVEDLTNHADECRKNARKLIETTLAALS